MGTSSEEQPATMKAEPQQEHQWLNRLLGEWTTEMEGETESGERATFTGTESVRSLGGLWIIAEGQGEVPGGGIGRTIMTVGYDPQKKRYVGTFIGSMMTHLWVYDGHLDAGGMKLMLDSEGPSMTGDGGMAQYRDAIEFKSDDHRLLTSQVLREDGSWQQFMTAEYRRKK